ncbi:hypothetical protein [Campylobacter sp. RM9333]
MLTFNATYTSNVEILWNKEMCKEVKEEIKGVDKTAQAILFKMA